MAQQAAAALSRRSCDLKRLTSFSPLRKPRSQGLSSSRSTAFETVGADDLEVNFDGLIPQKLCATFKVPKPSVTYG